MARITHDQRVRIVTLKNDAGWTLRQLADRFGVNRRSIQRLLAKHREHQSVDDLPHPRRPKLSNERDDGVLIRMSEAAPTQVARQLRQRWSVEHHIQASVATVKRRLIQAGLRGRIAKRKPLLTQRHKDRRLAWAQLHRDWTEEHWRRCLFSDESPLHLVNSRQRRYVRRRPGTAMRPEHLRPTVHSSSGKMMVWGAFSYAGIRPFARVHGRLNAEAYCNLLQRHLVPLDLPGNNFIFQQDNATCHTARRTQRFLQDNNIEVLQWPAQSPDINPIENLWSQIQQQVDRMVVHGMDGLWQAAQDVWMNIEPQVFQNLIRSMPRRVELVIAANGGAIPY